MFPWKSNEISVDNFLILINMRAVVNKNRGSNVPSSRYLQDKGIPI